MPQIDQVADEIYRLETPVAGTTTPFSVYLIKGTEGILIEPGPASALPQIREGMEKLGMMDVAFRPTGDFWNARISRSSSSEKCRM